MSSRLGFRVDRRHLGRPGCCRLVICLGPWNAALVWLVVGLVRRRLRPALVARGKTPADAPASASTWRKFAAVYRRRRSARREWLTMHAAAQ